MYFHIKFDVPSCIFPLVIAVRLNANRTFRNATFLFFVLQKNFLKVLHIFRRCIAIYHFSIIHHLALVPLQPHKVRTKCLEKGVIFQYYLPLTPIRSSTTYCGLASIFFYTGLRHIADVREEVELHVQCLIRQCRIKCYKSKNYNLSNTAALQTTFHITCNSAKPPLQR
jgi:hypothetical protein